MTHLLQTVPVVFYVIHYLLAGILVFQGVQQIEEQRAPMGVLPAEVVQKPAFHVFWGWTLLGLGAFAAVLGLGSHAAPSLGPLLVAIAWVEVLAVAVFALALVFMGRKIEYLGKASAPVEHGHP